MSILTSERTRLRPKAVCLWGTLIQYEEIMEQQSKPSQEETGMEQHAQHSKLITSRRSFLSKGLAVGGAGVIGAGLLANGLPVFAEESRAVSQVEI